MNENQQPMLPEEDLIDLSALVNILLGKWYWFVASILLCGALGALYLYKTPKAYRKQATVMVKESKSSMSQGAAFADIAGVAGLSASNTENELLILKSRTLMEEVVYRLGAHITYYQPKFLRKIELYDNTPFRLVEQERGTLVPATMELTPLDADRFTARVQYYAVSRGEMADTVLQARFNEPAHFPFGIATVEAYPQLLQYFKGQPIEVLISTPKRAAGTFLGGLSVTQMSKASSMLVVSFQGSHPRKAADVLNVLLDQYNRDAIADKNQVLENSDRFIQERLAAIRQELGEVDGRIEGYKRSALSTNIQTESQIYLQSASSLEEKSSATLIQLNLVNILADFLSLPANKRELLPYNIGLDNTGLNAQIQTYNDNLIRLNRMIAASSERNPVVADLGSSLESARASIVKTVADMQHSLKLQQQQLSNRSQRTTGRIEAVATNERSVQSITRDQKIKAELYLYLLNKSEENAILKSTTEPNARIIDKAFGADTPVAPLKAKIMLVLLLIGAILPAAFFVLKDLLYTKVRGRGDVSKVVKAPILGEIPSKEKRHQNEAIVVKPGANSQVSEAFRILRTNLSFMQVDKPVQVIGMTSSMPREGKTYVSMNLAMSLALTGKRVCLVDLDLRRCSLSRAMHVHGKTGVTEYLAGQVASPQALICTSELHESLSIIPSGVVPPNPAELLMQERYDRLIAELRQQFDYIVLDSPPVHVVADAKIANRNVDLTTYVVRAGVLDRRELDAVESLYREQVLTNMTVIVTDVDYEQLYYSVGYKGYGKGYGYSRYNSYGKGYYGPVDPA